jgi:ABC-type bacteriocin/lantibiotic exporter with double-glycine peptidase domain
VLNLYAAIWRVSGRRQMVLIVLSVIIAALAAAPLEFQKRIINLLGDRGAGPEELLALGAGMMGVILLSLGLKWLSGYRSGLLGEDLIRLIRTRLVATAADQSGDNRLPMGTLATAVTAEAEELGKFAGSAFSEPVVQIGTLISVVGFIATTQPKLGAIALAMILPQMVLVYLSQRRVNALLAERVRVLRRASNGITGDDLRDLEQQVLADFDSIYETRRRMFIWKLSTKFLLSAINGAGTVTVLTLGGWMALQGLTDVGTVVAAATGLSRIQGPTAFMIAFYRQVSANRVKFDLLRDLLDTDTREPAAARA